MSFDDIRSLNVEDGFHSFEIKMLKESSKWEHGTELVVEQNRDVSMSHPFSDRISATLLSTAIMAPYPPALSTTRKSHYRIAYSRPTNDHHCSAIATGPVLDEVPHQYLTLVEFRIPGITDLLFLILSMRDLLPGGDRKVPVHREEDDEDDESVSFLWGDEQTLIAELSHDGRVESDDDENVVKLINSLEHSFARYSNILVNDIAQTLVPAGLWEFHETCKKLEFTTLKDADEVRIADIMGELKDAYARRDELWTNFEVKLNSTVDPTIEMLKDLPARMARAISEIDKQSKKLNKDDVGP
ncbi:hypothetical protein IW261DRAFT_1606013 [Armillaria novae-zelandiae]|uniref:Uncharacterized protein n=1 Tax=Armillaria novae-zelandiae TaxID=153914 RepID=A0AA39PGN4_9AGAR|nr:hypothetical protein IW261DRAFT_1606013 [Armillaria novae-zelandiae]